VTAPQGSDVLIIGGGVIGTSAALFLAKRGRNVTLIERFLVGQQASGTNFGNVRRQGRPVFEIPLTNRACDVWRSMPELLGTDCEFIPAGHLRICYHDRPDALERFHRYAADVRPLGLELEILEGSALRKKFPFFGKDVLAGSWSPLDGHANPRLVAPAFARAAVRAGVTLRENIAVQSATHDGHDFEVATSDGQRHRAPALLLCAGAWSSQFAAAFGEPVPLVTRAPTMSVTEPVPYVVAPSIGVSTPLEHESVYFRQIPRGNLIIGGSTRGPSWTDERRAPVVPENTLRQFEQIRRLVPAFARINLIRVWSGVESYTPDDTPVIGHSATTPGLHYGFGFSGSGFQIGPGVGATLAELIATGQSAIDLAPYSIMRFA
jgi:sarcosine oxidase, subunit beta